MRIGIDASALVKDRPTGVEVATRDLIKAVLSAGPEEDFILYTPKPLEGWEKANVTVQLLPPTRLWTQRALGPAATKDSLGIFWSPSYMLPLTFKGKGVVTIHGLEFHKYPKSYTFKNWLLSYLTVLLAKYRAHHLIAVSESVKRDLINLLGISQERISVVYNALSPFLAQRIHMAVKDPNSKPYILAVGRVEPRKNQLALVNAFALLAEDHKDLELHIVGFVSDVRYGNQIRAAVKKSSLENRVKLIGHVDHQELGSIYKNATVVALVSLDEGFGIPVLEGFAAESPVVTAKYSATAEVAGDAALLVDPQDPASIAGGIHQVLTDPALTTQLIQKGQQRLLSFSWDKSAKQLLEIFHRI